MLYNQAMNKPSNNKLTGRDKIIAAAKFLFTEQGYEATSPQAIYAESGLGQSSFYHHFKNKLDLMNVVLQEVCKDIQQELESIEEQNLPPVEKIETYLQGRNRGSKGCRIGRYIYEASAQEQLIAKTIEDSFELTRSFLKRNIQLAQQQQQIISTLSAEKLSDLLISHVQGSYLLGRAKQDDQFIQNNLKDIMALIKKTD